MSALIDSIMNQRARTRPELAQLLQVVENGGMSAPFFFFVVTGIVRMARRQARLTAMLVRICEKTPSPRVDIEKERAYLENYEKIATRYETYKA